MLVRAIGVSPPTITRFMHDDRSISLEIVDEIFLPLGLDVVQGTSPQDLTIFAKTLGRPPKPKSNPHDGDPDISKHGL